MFYFGYIINIKLEKLDSCFNSNYIFFNINKINISFKCFLQCLSSQMKFLRWCSLVSLILQPPKTKNIRQSEKMWLKQTTRAKKRN